MAGRIPGDESMNVVEDNRDSLACIGPIDNPHAPTIVKLEYTSHQLAKTGRCGICNAIYCSFRKR